MRSLVSLVLLVALCMIAAPGALSPVSHVGVAASDVIVDDVKPVAKRDLIDDEVRVFFCTSCGFYQSFMEVKKYLEDTYPHLVDRVYGANYEIDPMKKLFAQFLGYVQIAGMVLMVFGESIFNALGLDTTLLQKALDNRIGCFAVILLLGSVSQGMVSTGAFEIYYNEDLIFSKLQHDRWPTLEELSQLLAAKGLQAQN